MCRYGPVWTDTETPERQANEQPEIVETSAVDREPVGQP